MILEIKLSMDHQTRYLLKCQEVKDMTYKYEQSQIQLAKLTETYNQLKQNYSLVLQEYTQLQRETPISMNNHLFQIMTQYICKIESTMEPLVSLSSLINYSDVANVFANHLCRLLHIMVSEYVKYQGEPGDSFVNLYVLEPTDKLIIHKIKFDHRNAYVEFIHTLFEQLSTYCPGYVFDYEAGTIKFKSI